MTIKYEKDWTKVSSLGLQYHTETLAEFLSWIKEQVPEGTPNEDILLDFEIYACEDCNDYGDTYIALDADLNLSIKNNIKD